MQIVGCYFFFYHFRFFLSFFFFFFFNQFDAGPSLIAPSYNPSLPLCHVFLTDFTVEVNLVI